MRWTRWPRGRDLEFLGKSSFVDLARLLLLVGSRKREEEGWSWVGTKRWPGSTWSIGSLGQPRPALGEVGVEATFRLLACQSRISAS